MISLWNMMMGLTDTCYNAYHVLVLQDCGLETKNTIKSITNGGRLSSTYGHLTIFIFNQNTKLGPSISVEIAGSGVWS